MVRKIFIHCFFLFAFFHKSRLLLFARLRYGRKLCHRCEKHQPNFFRSFDFKILFHRNDIKCRHIFLFRLHGQKSSVFIVKCQKCCCFRRFFRGVFHAVYGADVIAMFHKGIPDQRNFIFFLRQCQYKSGFYIAVHALCVALWLQHITEAVFIDRLCRIGKCDTQAATKIIAVH